MNSLMSHYRLIVVTAVLTALFLLIRIFFKWKGRFDKKNMQLMQLYMELKFLYKNIQEGIIDEAPTNFCSRLIASIKEYYNLENLIIVDAIKMELNNVNLPPIKKTIYEFLLNNEQNLKNILKEEDVVVKVLEIEYEKYVLYIFSMDIDTETSTNGFIICIENYPSLLSKNELIGLKSNISLLKAKLLE